MDELKMIDALSLSSGSVFWIVKYAPLKLMFMTALLKFLVERRECDLHDVFQRLAILRRLRHELKTLQAAIEISRDSAEVSSIPDLAIFPSTQKRLVQRLFDGGHIAACPEI